MIQLFQYVFCGIIVVIIIVAIIVGSIVIQIIIRIVSGQCIIGAVQIVFWRDDGIHLRMV